MEKTHRFAGLFALIIGVGLLFRQISFFPYPEILTEKYFFDRGLLPYTQINDQHFPGIFFLPFTTVYQLRLVHFGLFAFTALLLFKLTKNLRWIIVYALFFLLWEGNTLWMDSFIAPLVLLAFWRLYTNKNIILTGLILGLVLLFKQHGIVVCLVGFLWIGSQKHKFKDLALFILMGATPMILAMIYLYYRGVFPDFWYWTVVHTLSSYTGLENKWPTLIELIKLGLVLLPATIGWLKFKQSKIWMGLFVLSTLIYLIPRFGLIHAQPALPLLIFLWSQLNIRWEILILGLVLLARIFAKEVPGRVWFYDDFVSIAVNQTRPIYVYGANDSYYHLTETLPPQKLWIELLKGNIIPGVEQQIITTLKNDPPQFVLVDLKASIDYQKISDLTPQILQYIETNFIKHKTLSNGVELWYAR